MDRKQKYEKFTFCGNVQKCKNFYKKFLAFCVKERKFKFQKKAVLSYVTG